MTVLNVHEKIYKIPLIKCKSLLLNVTKKNRGESQSTQIPGCLIRSLPCEHPPETAKQKFVRNRTVLSLFLDERTV